MGPLSGFKAGQRARSSRPLKLQAANKWPSLLHVTGLPPAPLEPWRNKPWGSSGPSCHSRSWNCSMWNVRPSARTNCDCSNLPEHDVVKTWEWRGAGQSGHAYINKYLSSTCWVPDTVLDVGGKAVHERGKFPGSPQTWLISCYSIIVFRDCTEGAGLPPTSGLLHTPFSLLGILSHPFLSAHLLLIFTSSSTIPSAWRPP